MSKFVSPSHVTAEKGVIAFANYCVNHNPVILWREETKHDYGVDGEIELTKVTKTGKTEATSKVVKVQLKSTKRKSYIAKETNTSFEFLANINDIKYWQDHSLPVILVVYFENEEVLYAKKIDKGQVLKNRKTHRILFNKQKDLLTGKPNMAEVTGQEFISRINYGTSENLHFNFFEVYLPPYIYKYQCKFTDPQDIFGVVKEHDLYPTPEFSLESNTLYYLDRLERYNKTLRENILEIQGVTKIKMEEFIKSGQVAKNTVVRIVNTYLRRHLRHKQIYFDKHFKRYYFAKVNDQPLESKVRENAVTDVYRKEVSQGKSGRKDPRIVVGKYTYYESSSFYKHLAFEIHFEWIEDKPYVIIDPKYLYTEDGTIPLLDKKRITKLTNRLKQSERNTQFLNHIYFLRNFISRGPLELFYENEKNKLQVLGFETIRAPFSIVESRSNPKIKEIDHTGQRTLFDET